MSGRYGPEPRPLADRFWSHVVKAEGCWVWSGRSDWQTGYGRIRQGGRDTPHLGAHRVSWELHNGPIPEGLVVCHTCDNPPCVRPDHLFLGTVGDNNRDSTAKGRHVSGERWYAARPDVTRWPNGYPRRVQDGRPRRSKPDPVTAAVRWAVMRRDRMCVLARFDAAHQCRDRWGNPHASTSTLRLTVEHVKDELRMGRRAPSDIDHLVALCYGSNVGVPSKRERQWMRDYLAHQAIKSEPEHVHVDLVWGCPDCYPVTA